VSQEPAEQEETHLKRLTIDNWNEIDPIIASGVFVRVSLADGSVETVTSRHWIERSLRPQLSPEVPEAVRFDIARGAILYGVCFYPLFTLGLEQILRVQEAAARARAVLLGVRVGKRPYEKILDELHTRGLLSPEDHEAWTIRRRLRNLTTHADRASILLPAQAMDELTRVADSINRLFQPEAKQHG